MSPSRYMRALAALLAAAACHGSNAFELSGGAAQQRYRATERFASGAVFNEEEGDLRGPRVRLAAGSVAWTLVVEAQRTSGTVPYDGRTQIGLPLQTQTDLRQTEASALLLRRFFDGSFQVGGGIGSRRVDRRIRATPPSALYPTGTQGLTERLQAVEWHATARASTPAFHGARIGIEGDWIRATRGRLDAGFDATFDAARVDLDDWSGSIARFVWVQQLGAARLRVFHEWHRHDPPASAPRALTVGGVDAGASFSYPGSEVRSRTIGFELGLSF